MLSFISLGSGSSGNCYYLFNGAFGILIDAGISARTLKKHFTGYGLRLDGIRYMLITHDHADHVKYAGKISAELNLPVYATAMAHRGIAHNYCVRQKIHPRNIRIMQKGGSIVLGEPALDGMDAAAVAAGRHCAVVTSFDVPHDSNDNVGYKIEWEDAVFCLITDAGHVTDEMKRRIGEAQYLVIEANHDTDMLMNGTYPQSLKERVASDHGHLSNLDCGKAIAENASQRLRHAWLCHLSHENNSPQLALKTVADTLERHGIVPGRDIQIDALLRNTPSRIFNLDGEKKRFQPYASGGDLSSRHPA